MRVVLKGFDEQKHARKPKGQGGGEFAPKGISGNVSVDMDTRDEAAHNAYVKEAVAPGSTEYRDSYPTWTGQQKGQTKNRIVTELAKHVVSTSDPQKQYAIANEAIKSWTNIGGEEQTPYHKAIAEQHGANFPEFKKNQLESYLSSVSDPTATMNDARELMKAMYSNTQDMLKRNGAGESVTLYRGIRPNSTLVGNHQIGDEFEMDANPISSWTSQPSIAHDAVFMGGGNQYKVIKASIPRDRILSTAQTGFGAINEHEFTVIHKKGDRVRLVA